MDNSSKKVRRYQLSNVSKIEDIPPNGTFMLADALLQSDMQKPTSAVTEMFHSSVEQSEAVSSPDKASEGLLSSHKVSVSGDQRVKQKVWESSPNIHTTYQTEKADEETQNLDPVTEVGVPSVTYTQESPAKESIESQVIEADTGSKYSSQLKIPPQKMVLNTERTLSLAVDASLMTPGFEKAALELPLETPPQKSELKFILEAPVEETPKVVTHQLTFYVTDQRASQEDVKQLPRADIVDKAHTNDVIKLQSMAVREQQPSVPLKPLCFTPHQSREGSKRIITVPEVQNLKEIEEFKNIRHDPFVIASPREVEVADSPGRALSINPGINQGSNDVDSPVLPHKIRLAQINQSSTELAENRKVLVKSSVTDKQARPVSMPLIPAGESPIGSLRMDVMATDHSRSVINHNPNNNQVHDSAPKSPSNGPSERDLSRKNSRSVIGSTKGKADEYNRKNINRMKMHLEETVRHNKIYRGNSIMDFDDSKSVKSQILNEDRMKKRLQEQFPKADAFLENDSVRSLDLNDEQAKLTQMKKDNQMIDTAVLLKKQMTKKASEGDLETHKLPGDSKLFKLQALHAHTPTGRIHSGPVHPRLLMLVIGIFLFEALRNFINRPIK